MPLHPCDSMLENRVGLDVRAERFNTYFHMLLREKFRNCCNASYSMTVTQENSPLGHIIHYDAQKRSANVTETLHSLFPKKSHFEKPLKDCAVVGNGGILNNSYCGIEIDRADFVIRLNLPPLYSVDDVGTKTDLVTANPSILINKFRSLREQRKPFITMMKEYGSSLILLPAFSFSMNTEVSYRALYTIEDFGMNSTVVFFNPDYLRQLHAYWRGMGLKFRRLSSGLMLVSVAAEVCENVTLYGFWPFSEDLDGVWIPHHYYDNVLPKSGFHGMSDEFHWYLKMHAKGSLRLNLGQC
ncbi:PREDICTED: alpha-N-acetylneuraminide alpha-2,8-sialyltransferase-like [Nanorana parkeri]|uniref:alpha-N-acetylneuraminide alpha-2,8-sialyltransferase-like n=1 Tax=Nanorana parkeri TaxID=125878 RepID=UPI0008547672|nr:PREDICTED: alpha-N-acetylneuraminide alpha-2,8-sialyltransferase-like [Nanorana parkeri]